LCAVGFPQEEQRTVDNFRHIYLVSVTNYPPIGEG
jgi:hypothetical protein